jgi:hypothetical protein
MSWAHWSSAWTATTSTSVNPPSILGLTPTNPAVKQPTTSQDIPDEIVKRADAFLQDLSDELGLAFGRPTSQHPSPSPKTQQAKPNHASPPRNPSYLETQRLDSEIETLQPTLSHLQSPKSHLTTAAGAKTKPIRLRPEVVRHLFGGPRHSQLVALEGLQWITPPSRDEPGYFKDHRGKTWEIRPADEGGRGMDGDGKRGEFLRHVQFFHDVVLITRQSALPRLIGL